MSGPNKTIANNRRATVMVAEETFRTQTQAEAWRDEWKAKNPDHTVRITTFRIGPRNSPTVRFAARAYRK